MEVGCCCDIPGEAGCCACLETRSTVDEVVDDYLQKLVRKSMRLAIHRDTCPIQNNECGCVIDCDPVPNWAGDEVSPYDTLTIEHKSQSDRGER